MESVCECPSLIAIKDLIQSKDVRQKYVQEISAGLLDNYLTIKLEKYKKKKGSAPDPCKPCEKPCDDIIEIKRPVGNERPKIVNKENCDEIIFKHPSNKVEFGNTKDENQQSLHYKVEPCKKFQKYNSECRKITVFPGTSEGNTQEIHGDRITCDNEDIFLVRVQKSAGAKKRNLELELRTPKPPTPPCTPPPPSPPTPEEMSAETSSEEESKDKPKNKSKAKPKNKSKAKPKNKKKAKK